MKAFKTLLLLLALGLSVYGQAVNVTANKLKGSATAPSGACSAQQVQLTTAGVVYVCASGTWTSSGGGTTINSTNGQVPYRVNSTTFGDSAFASNALNSTYLSATSGASGAGLTLAVAGGGTNENLLLGGKGSGYVGTSGSSYFSTGIGYYLADGVNGIINSSGVKLLSTSIVAWVSGGNANLAGDTAIARAGSSIVRITNASTGAGQLLIGTSTDTADAQLSVYSQSTTRTGLKLNMPSGTSGSQEAFGNYDNGTRNLYITAAGTILYATDNAVDIGASGANRPRSVYVGANVFAGGYMQTSAGGGLQFGAFGYLSASADGRFLLQNNAATDFGRLQFGGTTSSFPSLKRSSTALETKLADDSAYAEHRALTFSVNNACVIRSGSGSPESAVTGNVCDLYLRTDGGASTTMYIKESGTGNTGWVAK